MSVCVAMRSAVLRPTELKLGTGVGFGELGGNRQLFVTTRQVKGHLEVKSSRNALWLPNLVSRTPDHSVVHCWGQRSCRGHRGQVGSICLAMPYDHQIWWEEPLSRLKCIAGVKGHVEVIWGQVGVNLLSNDLRPPNLVGRTPEHSVMHCWG